MRLTKKIPRPDKRLGQHFLVDKNIIDSIISGSGITSADLILEVGPGLGAMTIPLSRHVQHIVAVEKDRRLIPILQERLWSAGIENVTLVHHDILEWDFATPSGAGASGDTKWKVIGNLPYNISSPMLEKIINNRDRIDKAILMLQKEVADRLTALPGTKAYGALTLIVAYHARVSPLLEVKNTSFYPRPKVGSTVVQLDLTCPYESGTVGEKEFKGIVKGAFAHRRKTLINSLRYARPDIDMALFNAAMEECGIDRKRRAETLSMDEYLSLTSIYYSKT